MATTTTNFGFDVPTSSDLVKNGATAISTLGQDIDTFLAGSPTRTAGKNKVINGDFGISQRGTSFTITSAGVIYTLDRWNAYQNGNGTVTVTQQAFTAGAAPVAGYEGSNFARVNVSSVGTTTDWLFRQPIEDVRTFAGQTVTLSFWAKASASQTIKTQLTQNFGSGGSSSVATVAISSQTLTSSWVRYSATVSIPSISGKTIGTGSYLLLQFNVGSGGIGAGTVDFWGVQVEAGSIATPFQTASGGSPQAELAMCQRYYYRHTATATGDRFGTGNINTTTVTDLSVFFPTTMRTAPTALEQSGTAGDYSVRSANANTTCSAVPTFAQSSPQCGNFIFTVASGLTVGYGSFARAVNTNAYLGWSAEL